jgi:hypothetical protein
MDKLLKNVIWNVTLCGSCMIKTDVLKERIASIVRVTSISELGTTLTVTSN